MLKEILTADSIRFAEGYADWREAVRVSCEPLLERGAIAPSYIDAIIENVEKIGPYIVISPDVAIPHARPEAGARAIAMALLKTTTPVKFSDDPDHHARMLFAFSATDNHSHQRALRQLARLIMDEQRFAQLQAASTAEAVLELIAGIPE
ncbi:PTS sugar transporter subunit IIA [Silvimonas iriomotensis]|uniref:Ascorbate-specific PTS system EIIA component n=1 Tax=Silvimonas iriomotensis TaxID=449662 RepID=A0ABQ2PBH6_9NEIS|nr:PTS sugar transporter subunit IIA [Silvimonas iriomotensis]GGP22540.1 PTS ascorbate transporter subunit IIA [Silvimonas iriomotensis]